MVLKDDDSNLMRLYCRKGPYGKVFVHNNICIVHKLDLASISNAIVKYCQNFDDRTVYTV